MVILKIFYSNYQTNEEREDLYDKKFIFSGKSERTKISRNEIIVVEDLFYEQKEADKKLLALTTMPGSTIMLRSSPCYIDIYWLCLLDRVFLISKC